MPLDRKRPKIRSVTTKLPSDLVDLLANTARVRTSTAGVAITVSALVREAVEKSLQPVAAQSVRIRTRPSGAS